MIVLGIDFDNTIICYDRIFHREATIRQLIPDYVPPIKEQIRDFLRGCGQEEIWTELQGHVYGHAIVGANPFPGLKEFLQICRLFKIKMHIVSHKTKFPYRGKQYDLHRAALDWLQANEIIDSDKTGLAASDVFFAESKAKKLSCIADLGCTHFIDDLPEFLLEADFPPGVEKLLFMPALAAADAGTIQSKYKDLRIFTDWSAAFSLLTAEPVPIEVGRQ
ncbi:MAG: hypothetical protein K2X27_25130 [Candidatus Obscuribacterales bacterium]|nr:hypothetical protein [Candidatus Obscuribacterales bacterium]